MPSDQGDIAARARRSALQCLARAETCGAGEPVRAREWFAAAAEAFKAANAAQQITTADDLAALLRELITTAAAR